MMTHPEITAAPYWITYVVQSCSDSCKLPPALDLSEGLARYSRAGSRGERFLPAHRLSLMLYTGVLFAQVDYLNCQRQCTTAGCINPRHYKWDAPASMNLSPEKTKLTPIELKYIRKAEKAKQKLATVIDWEKLL